MEKILSISLKINCTPNKYFGLLWAKNNNGCKNTIGEVLFDAPLNFVTWHRG